MAKYNTPRVPQETPMYETGPDGKPRLSRTWMIFFERLGVWETTNNIANAANAEKKATFGLVKMLTVDQDLTNHFISRSSGEFTDLVINAKLPPTGSSAKFDIQISTDEGVSWNSIFTGAPLPEIPDGAGDLIEIDVFSLNPAYNRIQPNNLLRIDCTQIGATFAGQYIEFVLSWA